MRWVFLYKRMLENALGGKIDAVRAERKVNVPVVLMRDEVGDPEVLREDMMQIAFRVV